MASQNINELYVWQNGAPFVNIGIDNEFNIWQNGAPDEDIDESATAVVTNIRRRVFEF